MPVSAHMPFTEIHWWHWASFVGCVLVMLALDLGVFHRRAHVVKFKEALAWTTVWFLRLRAPLHRMMGMRAGGRDHARRHPFAPES